VTAAMSKKLSQGFISFLTFAGIGYWMASLLPALVGMTLPFWLRPPGFSFRFPAALEFLLAALLFHAGSSFLLSMFEGRATSTWTKQRLLEYAGVCLAAAGLLGLHLNSGLTLHDGVPRSLFIIYGLVTFFVGALYVIPPLNFHQRMGGEIVVAEGLGMIPVLGAYLVQVGDITRAVYLASLPLIVATGLWVWMEELASSSDDEKTGRRTLVIEFGVKFSARFGVLALAAAFLGTLIVAVISASTSPWTLIALWLTVPLIKIVIVSWKEHAHPERRIPLVRYAIVSHLVTGLILAASSLVTQLQKAG
jgi:1,4-dihydroxy-2-naphthoate octaprenyltransferase